MCVICVFRLRRTGVLSVRQRRRVFKGPGSVSTGCQLSSARSGWITWDSATAAETTQEFKHVASRDQEERTADALSVTSYGVVSLR